MAWRPRLRLLALVAGALSCVDTGAFVCREDAQCVSGDVAGRCELDGSCSFPDGTCESGRRYGASGAAALAARCTAACGEQGQACCPGDACFAGLACALAECRLAACGALGDACCPDAACGEALVCSFDECRACDIRAASVYGGRSNHTCAIEAADGSLWCWGNNGQGQLGDGTRNPRATPVRVVTSDGSPLAGAVQVSVGNAHTCARVGDGVRCWGSNNSGRLGDGTEVASNFPVTVVEGGVAMAGVVEVVAANQHSCALRDGGRVACWGDGNGGLLGDGRNLDSKTPVTVTLATGGVLDGVIALAAGNAHTCALRGDGTVACWGNGTSGQLGDGFKMNRASAVVVAGLAGARAIAAGGRHSCAVLGGDSAVCWGADDRGQLGDGGTALNQDVAVPVAGLAGVAQLALGLNHSCAVGQDGALSCWGQDDAGQLGDGATADALQPVAVAGLGATVQAALGAVHSCARQADGALRCWGDNTTGFQLGVGGDPARSATPLPVELGCP